MSARARLPVRQRDAERLAKLIMFAHCGFLIGDLQAAYALAGSIKSAIRVCFYGATRRQYEYTGRGVFTLLTQGMRNRTVETLQRALYHTLRDAILQGTLTARCRLPGSRVMAERLHLSRNTVNAALEQLALEGYLTRSRQGTQVAPLASCRQEAGQMPPVVLPERLQRLPAAMRRDSPTLAFTPGMPAVNYFPLPLWRRLIDNVLREDGSALLGYGEAAGDPLLREAIARHLALSRGIRCDIRQIVITEGALEGVNLCASLLTNPGDSVWLEEPGYLGRGVAFSGRDCGSEEWLSTMKGCVLPTASRSRPGSFSPLLHTSIPVGAS